MHTAVKIDPQYPGPVVYVKDASRAVGVAQNLIGLDSRDGFVACVKADYVQKREQHANRRHREPLLPLARVRANRPILDWGAYTPPRPSFLGARTFEDYPLAELAERIDWTPFFQAWELRGRYPTILDDAEQGEQARHLFADAQTMLDRIITDRWLTARAVIGFFPAHRVGDDDLALYADESREQVLMTLHHLRQQGPKPAGKPHYCLVDWITPRESGIADYLGAFAVTAGISIDGMYCP
jgi:5-methyltetrahydrofolate--homocysteine methyltransferase